MNELTYRNYRICPERLRTVTLPCSSFCCRIVSQKQDYIEVTLNATDLQYICQDSPEIINCTRTVKVEERECNGD